MGGLGGKGNGNRSEISVKRGWPSGVITRMSGRSASSSAACSYKWYNMPAICFSQAKRCSADALARRLVARLGRWHFYSSNRFRGRSHGRTQEQDGHRRLVGGPVVQALIARYAATLTNPLTDTIATVQARPDALRRRRGRGSG